VRDARKDLVGTGGYHHDAHLALHEAADNALETGPEARVQAGKWVVQDEQARVFEQRPGNQHLAHLAVGELDDTALHQVLDLEELEHVLAVRGECWIRAHRRGGKSEK